MNTVKDKVIRIVKALPPAEETNMVDVKPHEFVAVLPEGLTPAQVQVVERAHTPDPVEDATGASNPQEVKPFIRFRLSHSPNQCGWLVPEDAAESHTTLAFLAAAVHGKFPCVTA